MPKLRLLVAFSVLSVTPLNSSFSQIAKTEVGNQKDEKDAEDPVMKSIYEALQFANARVVGGPYAPGDTVIITYELKNASDGALRVPVNNDFSRPFHLVGTRQHWIEREGKDKKIPGIPPRIKKVGNKYAAGGRIINTKPLIAAGESLTFRQQIPTKGYPAGSYLYDIQYQKIKGKVIQTETVSFDLE